MKDQYLHILAKQVLQVIPDGLSKVRFAKILYFTHKGLVQKGLASVEDVKFIRMPLGPVPVGFKDLSQDRDISITESPSSLVYDKQLYTLKNTGQYFSGDSEVEIKRIVKGLEKLTTSELVTIAHLEPSWVNHFNGDEYFLEDGDLAINLPVSKTSGISPEIDEQHLQAKLVEGMLDDIVEESTSLEYPDSAKN